MKTTTRFKTALKSLLFTIGISPVISLLILLLHVATLILVLWSGATLREILCLLDGLLLSILLCFVDFNILLSPLQRQHVENLKREIRNDQTENRSGKDNPGSSENP